MKNKYNVGDIVMIDYWYGEKQKVGIILELYKVKPREYKFKVLISGSNQETWIFAREITQTLYQHNP